MISNDAGNSGGSNDTGNAVSYDPTGAPVQSASSNGTPGTVPSSDAGAASSSDNNNQNGNNTYDPVADYSAAVDNYVNSILGNLFG